MYGWDTLVLLQHLLDEGLTKTAIAQRFGVSHRVIYHWISVFVQQRSTTTLPRRLGRCARVRQAKVVQLIELAFRSITRPALRLVIGRADTCQLQD